MRRFVDRALGLLGSQRARARSSATWTQEELAPGPAAARGADAAAGAGPASRRPGSAGFDGAEFRLHKFRCAAGARDYKLFLPPARRAQRLPLVVMLHGCKQTPDDFALGTQMNAHAAQSGCAVAYPSQSRLYNPSGCWNWFRPSDQGRGHGEPAIIAGLTRELLATRPLDPARVYIAGLSAGGAMAAILGAAYPELYAAVGVHSGVRQGVAVGLASALATMRDGAGPIEAAHAETSPHRQPVIVFHGDADTTVNPRNAVEVYLQSIPSSGDRVAVSGATLQETIETREAPGGRRFTRTAWAQPDGRVIAELWVVHGAGHAWSGGDAGGSYTEPQGPNASAEMLRFFLSHPRPR